MYSEVAWVLVSSGTQVHPQRILNLDYLRDYPSVSYDYEITKKYIRTVFKDMKIACYNFRLKYFHKKISFTLCGNEKVLQEKTFQRDGAP